MAIQGLQFFHREQKNCLLSAFKMKKIRPFSMIYLTRNNAFLLC
ncbi:hypothetical protein HMPREF9151_01396 [Hoylesella saccharolytica F0055]|uniref:Uncharacterized protein n=1 Tax=Hoylesella saccharolytica F0055 TaxID=1127699 RepID=L1N9V7_9BACT|nr:hypothetical protein HMPREF9151_01396 [Hoylesella saccharolytica F0055]